MFRNVSFGRFQNSFIETDIISEEDEEREKCKHKTKTNPSLDFYLLKLAF